MGGKQLLGLALLAATPGHLEAASPKAPSSTTTVQIHLSVAPRMRLMAMGAIDGTVTAAPGGSYCLMSNAAEAALPIYLTWPGFEPAGSSPATPPVRYELAGCRGREAASGDATGTGRLQPAAGLALIYPE